jgi:hypothetical protein
MWQAIVVAIITAAAGVFTTLAVQRQTPKLPAGEALVSSTSSSTSASSKPIPSYTQNVDTAFNADEKEPYKWSGYKHDVAKLNSLVQDFLTYLSQNLGTSYEDAQSFYPEIDKAADKVHTRARDAGQGNEELVNYNWKVYSAEYLFRLEIQELRKAHEAKQLDADKIKFFKNQFCEWLSNQSGEKFDACAM